MWAKNEAQLRLEFPVWQCAFGLISLEEVLGRMQLCSTATNIARSGHVDVREAKSADARHNRVEAW